MFPFFTIWWAKIYMTWIGIIIAFLTFVVVVWYLSKRFLQWFWRFFYRLPLAITLSYLFGSYLQFVLTNQTIFPSSIAHILNILWPHEYKFHFGGILIGLVISLFVFFRKIKTIENKKTRIDIFFYAFALCLIPLGIFLLLGDNFIGQTTNSFLGMKSLHSESQRNKFDSVYPIGLFLAIGALLIVAYFRIKRIFSKKRGVGFQWIISLLIMINLVLMLQQYPRYMVLGTWWISIDLKQHISFFVIMLCLYYHKQRHTSKTTLEGE